jgi:hypothetical protein
MSKSYEQLVKRVQKQIASPKAQSDHRVELQRQPDDAPEDWEQMLSDLGTVKNVTLTFLCDSTEHVRIEWNPEESMA